MINIFKKELIILLNLLLTILLSLNAYSAVFINEILANGIIEPDSEWVELFNNGSSDIDLSNFNISETSSKNFTLNTTMPANSFIVLVQNFTSFNSTFPKVNESGVMIIEFGQLVATFQLSNTAGTVVLYNSSGNKIDSIEYAQSSTQENISIGRYPDGSSNIINLSTLTPGTKNDNKAPTLNKWLNPSRNNTNISGSVNITINVTDDTVQVNSTLINFNGTNFSMNKDGDIWRFLWNTRLNVQKQYNLTVFFNDSYGKSSSDILFNITLNNTNSLPIITSLNLTNTDFLNRTNGTLQAFWSFNDADEDAITSNETLWYINNTLATNYTNKRSIPPLNTTKLENWTFSVRVFDGFNWSDFVNSSKIKILNAKPLINITSSIELSETQKVNITLSSDDLDNDLLNYTINDSKFFREGNYFIWNTNLSNAGIHRVNIIVNDSTDIDSIIVNVTITDARDLDNDGDPDFNETDDDNDGILDENDFLIGNVSSINTTLALSIAINGTSNLSKLFNGTFTINITNGSDILVEFNFTFNSSNMLDFGNLTFNRTINGSSAVAIRGLKLSNSTKTVFLEKINTTAKSVCIKDTDAGFDSISSICDTSGETLLLCNNVSQSQYTCFDMGLRYKITGLNHSAVKEQCRDVDGDGYGTGCSAGSDCNDNDRSKNTDCSTPASSGGSGSGGSSGGGGVICISDWQCVEWSQCIDGFKKRECIDTSQCAFPQGKPIDLLECVVSETKEDANNLVKAQAQQASTNKTTEEIKHNITTNLLSITGQPTKTVPNTKPHFGIFIMLIEVFIIVGAYLVIKNFTPKYQF